MRPVLAHFPKFRIGLLRISQAISYLSIRLGESGDTVSALTAIMARGHSHSVCCDVLQDAVMSNKAFIFIGLQNF